MYSSETGYRIYSPAADLPLSVAEAKSHLRNENDVEAEDDDIEVFIKAAVAYVEGRGHLIMAQTWDYVLDRFPCGYEPIKILKRPVQSISSVKYFDADGNEQTWSTSEYQAAVAGKYARIAPKTGYVYPVTNCQMEAVTVRFVGGYLTDASPPAEIPANILAALKLIVGHLYANREQVVILQGIVSLELPFGVEQLIQNLLGESVF